MKKIISILLSVLLIVGCVAISATADANNIYTTDDVASVSTYVAGSWSETTGEFTEHTKRIATNGYVAVDASKTYTLTGKGHSNLQFYLVEFDADKNFVAGIGKTTIGNGTYTYTPSSENVAYIALSVTIQTDAVAATNGSNGLIERWTNGTISITMVADGESGEEPESTTVTTATTTTTTTTQTPEGPTTYTNQSAWVDGQKYLLIMPSCLTEGYMGKGILITNGVVASTYTGTDTVTSLQLDDYDCSSVNTKKECNALLSFSTSMDLSQYYFTAVKQDDYFAFKTSDGKYLCAGPQEGKNAWDWNRTYFSDTIVDDALFTGEYITGATGSSDTNLGNNAFKVTSKTGYHLRTLNNGNVICKADADYYQGFVGFYTTGDVVVPDESESSSSSTTTTTQAPVVSDEYTYVFMRTDNTTDFVIDADGLSYNSFNDYNGKGLQIQGITTGKTLTFTTTSSIESGIYLPTLYARAYSGRAKFDVYINDTLVASSLDTSTSTAGTGSYKSFELSQVTLPAGAVTIKFVAVSGGSFMPDEIVFQKIGDADPTDIDISMQTGAAIRLNVTNGIRFYTQVDADKIASLIADGYTVEMGTLIAPADLLTDKELTFESGVSCLDVEYIAKDTDDNFIYYDGENTIVGSIVEIKETSTSWSKISGNITRPFVGRGYVKLTKDGETTIKYAEYANGDIANNSRSLQYISYKYANDSSSSYPSLNEIYKALVDKWAAAVQ